MMMLVTSSYDGSIDANCACGNQHDVVDVMIVTTRWWRPRSKGCDAEDDSWRRKQIIDRRRVSMKSLLFDEDDAKYIDDIVISCWWSKRWKGARERVIVRYYFPIPIRWWMMAIIVIVMHRRVFCGGGGGDHLSVELKPARFSHLDWV